MLGLQLFAVVTSFLCFFTTSMVEGKKKKKHHQKKSQGDIVRERCVEIFEIGFPNDKIHNGFSSVQNSIHDFSKVMVTKPESKKSSTVDVCLDTLQNYTRNEFARYILKNYNPENDGNTWKVSIISDIMVSGKTCSFHKRFFQVNKNTNCYFEITSFLAMELHKPTKNGKLLQWKDNYDYDAFEDMMEECYIIDEDANSLELPQTDGKDEIDTDTQDSKEALKNQCRKIFETAFPSQRWTSSDDLQNFANLIAPDTQGDVENYWACPQSGYSDTNLLTNFTSQDLMDWFSANGFDPDQLRFTEKIVSDITIALDVCPTSDIPTCSFDKWFVAMPNEPVPCDTQIMSHLVMQIDPDTGKVLKWLDYFDEEEFARKFGIMLECVKKHTKKGSSSESALAAIIPMGSLSSTDGSDYQTRHFTIVMVLATTAAFVITIMKIMKQRAQPTYDVLL